MDLLMPAQIAQLHEGLAAQCAAVRLLASMVAPVCLEVGEVREGLSTLGATVRSLGGVR